MRNLTEEEIQELCEEDKILLIRHMINTINSNWEEKKALLEFVEALMKQLQKPRTN